MLALNNSSTTREALGGLIFVALFCLLYYATIWNRVVSPTGFGEIVFSQQWPSSFLPYRDYYFQSPPGYIILVKLVNLIFGNGLASVLALGVLLRTVSACAVFFLLLNISNRSIAAFAAILSVIVSTGDISDQPLFYNQAGITCLLSGLSLGIFGLRPPNKSTVALVLAGFFLAYAVSIKQTFLFPYLASYIVLYSYATSHSVSGTARTFVLVGVGSLLAALCVLLWLHFHQILPQFIDAILLAPSSKGGVGRSLLRPVSSLVDLPHLLFLTLLAWLIVITFLLFIHGEFIARFLVRYSRVTWLFLPALVSIASQVGLTTPRLTSRDVPLLLTASGWWGCLGLSMHFFFSSLDKTTSRNLYQASLSLFSFISGYSLSISWPLFESFSIPSLGVFISLAAERLVSRKSTSLLTLLLAACVLTSSFIGYRKASSPHSWGFWREPPLESPRSNFEHPLLNGLYFSEPAGALFSTAVLMTKDSRPDDRLFVFPNFPILYALTGVYPATKALMHWVDVTPKSIVEEDIAHITSDPPKFMIIRRLPRSIFLSDEAYFLDGSSSGISQAYEAIDGLRERYRIFNTLESDSFFPVEFLVRNDDTEKHGKLPPARENADSQEITKHNPQD